MAKELPYFRFTVAEWLSGDINMESYEIKGLFMDICSWYWFKDCDITRPMLEKRFINTRLIQLLFDAGFLKKKGKNVYIEYLDIQWGMLMGKHVKLSEAGRKGGKSKAKARVKPRLSYKDKDKEKDNNKDKIPIFGDFKDYALEKKADVNLSALKFKYESWIENGWKDGNDNKIVNWKSKLLNTLPYLKEKEVATGRNPKSENAPEDFGVPSKTSVTYEEYKAKKK